VPCLPGRRADREVNPLFNINLNRAKLLIEQIEESCIKGPEKLYLANSDQVVELAKQHGLTKILPWPFRGDKEIDKRDKESEKLTVNQITLNPFQQAIEDPMLSQRINYCIITPLITFSY